MTSPKGITSPFSPSRLLMSNLRSYRNLRQVSPDEGQGLAAENHAAWIETSAKTNVNVGTYNHLPPIFPTQQNLILSSVQQLRCLNFVSER